MVRQRVKGRTVSPLVGILLILGIALSIVVIGWIEQAIQLVTGSQLGAVMWLLVVAEAALAMRLSVMEYLYTVADDKFYIERVYGDHGRIVYDIPIKDIAAFGGKAEIFKEYGNGQSFDKAVMRHCTLKEMAIAYHKENSEQMKLLVIQPDEELRAALDRAIAEK